MSASLFIISCSVALFHAISPRQDQTGSISEFLYDARRMATKDAAAGSV